MAALKVTLWDIEESRNERSSDELRPTSGPPQAQQRGLNWSLFFFCGAGEEGRGSAGGPVLQDPELQRWVLLNPEGSVHQV